LGSWCVYDAQN